MHCKYGSFENNDIKTTLILTKQSLPRGYKWAIYIDNAAIHLHENVMSWCQSNNVPVCLNAKYRPDLMGIEFFWRLAKAKYRQDLTESYVRAVHIDNVRMVQDILNGIDNERAKKWALVGWQHLYNAEIKPANQIIVVDPLPLQAEYIEKLEAGSQNPQDSHLFQLNETDKRKKFVNTIFTAKLIQPKKRDVLWDESDWSPHKVDRNELI